MRGITRTLFSLLVILMLSSAVIAQGAPFDPNKPDTWTPENIALNAQAAFAKDAAKALEVLGNQGIAGAAGALRTEINKAFARDPRLIASRKQAAADFFKKGGALTGTDDSKAFTNFMQVMGLPLNKAPAGMTFDGAVGADGKLAGTLTFGTTKLPLDNLAQGTRLLPSGEGAKGKILICAPDAKDCKGVDVDGALTVKDGKQPQLKTDGHTISIIENGNVVVEVDSNVVTSIKELPTPQGAPGAERRFAFTDRNGQKFAIDTGPLAADRTPLNRISVIKSTRPEMRTGVVLRPGQDMSITGRDGRIHTISSTGNAKATDLYPESTFVNLGSNGFIADGSKIAYNGPVIVGKDQRALTYESKDRSGKSIEAHIEVSTTGSGGAPSAEQLTDHDNTLIIDGKGVAYAYGGGHLSVKSGNNIVLNYDGAANFGYSINPTKQVATYEAVIKPSADFVRGQKGGTLAGPVIAQRMPDGSTKTFQMEARTTAYQRFVLADEPSHGDSGTVKDYRVDIVPTEVRSETKAGAIINKAPIIEEIGGPTIFELPAKKATQATPVESAKVRGDEAAALGTVLPIPKDVAAKLGLPAGATSTIPVEPIRPPAVVTTTQDDVEQWYWEKEDFPPDPIKREEHAYALYPLVPGIEPNGIFTLLTPQISTFVAETLLAQTILTQAMIATTMQAALPLEALVPALTTDSMTPLEADESMPDYSMNEYFDEPADWEYPTEATPAAPAATEPAAEPTALPPYVYNNPTSEQLRAAREGLLASNAIKQPTTTTIEVFQNGRSEQRTYIIEKSTDLPFMPGEKVNVFDPVTGQEVTLSVKQCGSGGCGTLAYLVDRVEGHSVTTSKQPLAFDLTKFHTGAFSNAPFKDVIEIPAPSTLPESSPKKIGLTTFSYFNVNGESRKFFVESGSPAHGSTFTVYDDNGDPVTLQRTGGGCTSGGCRPATYSIVSSDSIPSSSRVPVQPPTSSSTDDYDPYVPSSSQSTSTTDPYATQRLLQYGTSSGTFVPTEDGNPRPYCCGLPGDKAVLYHNVKQPDGSFADVMYKIDINGRITKTSSVQRRR